MVEPISASWQSKRIRVLFACMFTGIVEEAGEVIEIIQKPNHRRLKLSARHILEKLKMGDSVACNGCCLTVAELDITQKIISFDLLKETLQRTNLGSLKKGDLINLERPMRPSDRLGGHMVSGHIDGIGKIVRWQKIASDWADYELQIEAPEGSEAYLVPKGSICVDGISLTVGEVEKNRFNVWIIPHTYGITNLRSRKLGDSVNLEFDLVAKYLEKILATRFDNRAK